MMYRRGMEGWGDRGREGGTETSGPSVSLAELLRLSRSQRPRLPGGQNDLGALQLF